MKRTLKRMLPIILAMAMLIVCSTSAFAMTGAYPGGGNVLRVQEETVSIAKSGEGTQKSYSLALPSVAFAGSYVVEGTFNFSTLGYVPSLIKLYSGETALVQVVVDTENNLKIRYSTATGSYSYTKESESFDTGIDVMTGENYNIKLVVSLDSREVFAFVNGEQVGKTTKMYIRETATLEGAVSDPVYANTDSSAKYTVSGLKIAKAAINSSSRITTLWEEDFESYNSTKYHSATNIEIDDATDKNGKTSKMWHASKNTKSRLLLDASSNNTLKNASGIIETSVDFKFDGALPKGSFDILYGMSADRNQPVYRIYADGSSLYLDTQKVGLKWSTDSGYSLYDPWTLGSPSFATIQADKWYTVTVCVDTYSKRLWVYLDGTLCNADKTYFVKSLGDCGTILNINHNNDNANASAYYDNYKCVMHSRTENDGFTVIERNGFNSGLITHSENAGDYYSGVVQFGNASGATIENGQLVVESGDIAIGQMSQLNPITSGDYMVQADFKFEQLNTASEHNSVISSATPDYGSLANISQLAGSLYAYVYTDYNNQVTRKYVKLIDKIDTEKWYTIGYRIDFASGRIRYYVDGTEVNADVVMYVPTTAELKLLRPLSINANKNGYNGKVLVDNFVLGKYSLDSNIALDAGVIKNDVTLPATALNGSIAWSSSNSDILSADGKVNTANLTEEEYVTLTAKVPVSGSGDHRTYLSKEYTFIVRPDINKVNAVFENGVAAAETVLYKLSEESLPTANVIVAVYDNSGALKLVKSAKTTDYNNGKNFFKGGLNVSIDTTSLESGNYVVKGFVFDSFSTLVPQAPSDECTFTK